MAHNSLLNTLKWDLLNFDIDVLTMCKSFLWVLKALVPQRAVAMSQEKMRSESVIQVYIRIN